MRGKWNQYLGAQQRPDCSRRRQWAIGKRVIRNISDGDRAIPSQALHLPFLLSWAMGHMGQVLGAVYVQKAVLDSAELRLKGSWELIVCSSDLVLFTEGLLRARQHHRRWECSLPSSSVNVMSPSHYTPAPKNTFHFLVG